MIPFFFVLLDNFNIVADFCMSKINTEQLFYNGYKYFKDKTCKSIVYWKCVKFNSDPKCKARANTKSVNGVIMMKLGPSEHCHDIEGNNL